MREIAHSKPRTNKSVFKIIAIALFSLIILIAVIKIFHLENFIFRGPTTVVELITNSGLKSDKGRVNILLLGIGGSGHEGPNLSDTIILASIDKSGKDVALISIPRDLWSPKTSTKINAVYAYGEEIGSQGLENAKDSVKYLFDMPIHYSVRLDFRGFEKATDQIGGIDVEVENNFTDPKYPIAGKEDDTCGFTIETQVAEGFNQVYAKDATGSAVLVTEDNNPFVCRYETLTFTKGLTHMDGKTALKFVRSRHGNNNEGTDFARSARQQKIIMAFRQKVLSTQTFLNPKTVITLIKTFGDSIDTDIHDDDALHFAKLFQKVESGSIRTIVLDSTRDESRLIVGNPQDYKGQFVLIPKDNSWVDLAEYIQQEIFKLEEKKD